MDAPPPIVAREYPYEPTFVDADGVRLAVVDEGPEDAAETLLFVHGNPAWGFLWRKLVAPALEAGHRVVVPDHAGLGRSDKPKDRDYHTLERHVGNLEAVVEARGLSRVTLVLHDWGGPFGMGVAARNPALVERIVVANTAAFAPRKERSMSAWHKVVGSPLGYQLGVRFNLVEWSAMRFGVHGRLQRDVLEAYRWPMRDEGARVAAGRLVQLVPDGPEHPTARTLRSFEENYPKLADKPMLVLWADRDPVFRPWMAERWLKDFPDADVRHVSQTAGHFWQEDHPEAFLGPLLDLVAKG